MYGMTGGVEAVGRVAGARIMAGEGEPYFVRRDRIGRIERVIYPNASGKDKPQLEQRYDYAADGRLARVAVVDQTSSDQATYGPEKYVVEYAYDEMGRLRKKQVRNNPVNEDDIFFEGDYEYDGMGRLAIERIWQYDKTAKRLLITRETRTTYDLMGNPTEIKYYDVDGFAFTEQRTYARGGQLTGFSIPTTAANVTVDTAGSYSYNTNNDMTGTKKLDAYRTISGTNYKIVFRAQWTFSFDRKNRLKTHTYPSGLNVRGNIWYDGMGRIWQRWNDDSVTGDWDADLKRFVYDGPALAQEHKFTASGNGSWIYSYGRCDIDYLRKPDGIRQKVNNGVGGWDSHLLFNDGADVASRTPSGSSTTITRTLRTASGERLNDNPRMSPGLTTGSFNNISNLAKPNSYVESYGGGTELGTSSLGYDSLVQSGPVHQLPALGGMLLNSPPAGALAALGFGGSISGGALVGNGVPVRNGGGSSGCGSCSGGNGRPMSMMGAWTAKADAAGFGDPWCYICVCPENTKTAGSYGCFTRAEFETLKPFPCLAGMFSCEGCVRCDGSTHPIPSENRPYVGGQPVELPEPLRMRWGEESGWERIPWWRRPQPGRIYECMMKAISHCALEYELLWEKLQEILGYAGYASCLVKCQGVLIDRPLWVQCVLSCIGIQLVGHLFLSWMQAVAAVGATAILQQCFCEHYVDCMSGQKGPDDPDRWRHEECCNQAFRQALANQTNWLDAVYDCYRAMEGGGYFE